MEWREKRKRVAAQRNKTDGYAFSKTCAHKKNGSSDGGGHFDLVPRWSRVIVVKSSDLKQNCSYTHQLPTSYVNVKNINGWLEGRRKENCSTKADRGRRTSPVHSHQHRISVYKLEPLLLGEKVNDDNWNLLLFINKLYINESEFCWKYGREWKWAVKWFRCTHRSTNRALMWRLKHIESNRIRRGQIGEWRSKISLFFRVLFCLLVSGEWRQQKQNDWNWKFFDSLFP